LIQARKSPGRHCDARRAEQLSVAIQFIILFRSGVPLSANWTRRNRQQFRRGKCQANARCVHQGQCVSDGRLCIRFESGMFRTLLGKVFGLMLSPETTQAEAEALAAMLDKHSTHFFVASLEHEGTTEEERQWLLQIYDDMGLLDPVEDEERPTPN
jgi:hypothetical protein